MSFNYHFFCIYFNCILIENCDNNLWIRLSKKFVATVSWILDSHVFSKLVTLGKISFCDWADSSWSQIILLWWPEILRLCINSKGRVELTIKSELGCMVQNEMQNINQPLMQNQRPGRTELSCYLDQENQGHNLGDKRKYCWSESHQWVWLGKGNSWNNFFSSLTLSILIFKYGYNFFPRLVRIKHTAYNAHSSWHNTVNVHYKGGKP